MYKSIRASRFLLHVSNQKSDEVTEEAFGFQRVSSLDASESFLEQGDGRKETVGSNLLTQTQKQHFLAISNV